MGLDGTLRKKKMKKAPFSKISLLVQIGGEIIISTFMLWGLHTNSSKFGLGRNVSFQAGVTGAYKAYISPPICTNRLIFGKWTFFILFFLDLPTYPIISQIYFLWRHHFSCLLFYMFLVDWSFHLLGVANIVLLRKVVIFHCLYRSVGPQDKSTTWNPSILVNKNLGKWK